MNVTVCACTFLGGLTCENEWGSWSRHTLLKLALEVAECCPTTATRQSTAVESSEDQELLQLWAGGFWVLHWHKGSSKSFSGIISRLATWIMRNARRLGGSRK